MREEGRKRGKVGEREGGRQRWKGMWKKEGR